MITGVGFKDAVKAKMNVLNAQLLSGSLVITSSNKDIYMRAFRDALREYLLSQLIITYGWSAYIPGNPPTPDPVTQFQAQLTIIDPLAITQQSTVEAWGVNIRNALQSGCIIFPPAGFTTNTGTLTGGIPLVLRPFPSNVVTNPDGALLHVCSKIVEMILTMIPTTLSGTHGPYIGSTTGFFFS